VNFLSVTEFTHNITDIAHSCDTLQSPTSDIQSLDTSFTTTTDASLEISHDPLEVNLEQWICTPQEDQFMKSYNTTCDEFKRTTCATTSTPTRPKYIYIKPTSVSSHKRPTSCKTATLRNAKKHNSVDNLQVKVDCLIDKVERGVHWATTYISHNDAKSALEELTALRESLVKSRTSIHQQCAHLRLQMTPK